MCKDSKSSKLLKSSSKSKRRSNSYLKYRNYIRSKAFKQVREMILERDGHRCQTCGWSPEEGGNRVLSVHHRTYEHLYDEPNHLDDLICLCSVCHRAIHKARSNYNRFKREEESD